MSEIQMVAILIGVILIGCGIVEIGFRMKRGKA